MMKGMSMKKIMFAIATLFSFAVLATPSLVMAAPTNSASKDAVCEGLSQVGGSSCDANAPGQTGIDDIIKTGISILSIIVGIAAVIMIIIGGLRYVISGGDAGSISSAKNTIMYAIVGLVVAALAQIIVQFVLKKIP